LAVVLKLAAVYRDWRDELDDERLQHTQSVQHHHLLLRGRLKTLVSHADHQRRRLTSAEQSTVYNTYTQRSAMIKENIYQHIKSALQDNASEDPEIIMFCRTLTTENAYNVL